MDWCPRAISLLMGVFVGAKAVLQIGVTEAGHEAEVVFSVLRRELALQFQCRRRREQRFRDSAFCIEGEGPENCPVYPVPQQERRVRAVHFTSDRVVVVQLPAPYG